MKTIKTVNGFRKIDDNRFELVPTQLRTILQEHRASLITSLLMDDCLERYIMTRFHTRVSYLKGQSIVEALEKLKASDINVVKFAMVFDSVVKNDLIVLNNAIFYNEIDACIRRIVAAKPVFEAGRQMGLYS
jgi:hypothetical protein